jgi:putative acyl-CoA dehydrogenase
MTPSEQGFFQDAPQLANTWRGDPVLRDVLAWRLPEDVLADVTPGLDALGERAAGEMLALADEAERDPPRQVPFDAWGRRVDRLVVSPAWQRLHAIAAEEGIVATAYERRHGPWSRLHQGALLYLYHPSSAIASCPLAMTDGAARTLELHGDAAQRARFLPHLLSRDAATFWTAGQWMTERSGGSDVSGTATIARRRGDGGWLLSGNKWFTSATTAELALTLARVEGDAPAGLTLFLVTTREATPEGGERLRGIRILRLKDKLGTRALPTAELELDGAPAELVGGPNGPLGGGVRKIASVLNVTRLYNACCAAGYLGRGLALARDYAIRRSAFGRRLSEQPLHVETLAGLALEHAAAVHLVCYLFELLGRVETGAATADDAILLRLLTPVAKLFTARQAVAGMSETLEAFGGAGYVEDSGLPRLLRDAQVLAIWEGTTNVLALDMLRAIAREQAFAVFAANVERRLSLLPPDLGRWVGRVAAAVGILRLTLERGSAGGDGLDASARQLAYGIARTTIALLFLEHWAARPSRFLEVATQRWCARDLAEPAFADELHRAGSRRLLGLEE